MNGGKRVAKRTVRDAVGLDRLFLRATRVFLLLMAAVFPLWCGFRDYTGSRIKRTRAAASGFFCHVSGTAEFEKNLAILLTPFPSLCYNKIILNPFVSVIMFCFSAAFLRRRTGEEVNAGCVVSLSAQNLR